MVSSPAQMRLNPPDSCENSGDVLDWIVENFSCAQWESSDDPVFFQAKYGNAWLPWSDHVFSAFLAGLEGATEPLPSHERECCKANYEFGTRIRLQIICEISTVSYFSLRDTELVVSGSGGAQSLYENDLKLTVGEGMSLYTKEESLAEIRRHHDLTNPSKNYFRLIHLIVMLPDDVLIEW